MKKPASASNARRARNEIQNGLDTRSHISSGPASATHPKSMTARIARQIHWQLCLERGNSARREARLRMAIGLPPVPRSLDRIP
jgi:hypothetical protein